MKLRVGLLTGLVALMAALGIFSTSATTFAQEGTPGELDAEPLLGDDFHARHWLRHSIVVCAARVMNLEVEQVQMALRNGDSLKEIGIRAGVRPVQLEHGILRCEWALLQRLVDAGKLEPGQARHIFSFLEAHITRIINFHWDPGDESLTNPPPVDLG